MSTRPLSLPAGDSFSQAAQAAATELTPEEAEALLRLLRAPGGEGGRGAGAGRRDREQFLRFLRLVLKHMGKAAWKNASWARRLAIVGGGVALLGTGAGEGAGIAALGAAVGLPLWLLIAAGGAFVGMLADAVEEAMKADPKAP